MSKISEKIISLSTVPTRISVILILKINRVDFGKKFLGLVVFPGPAFDCHCGALVAQLQVQSVSLDRIKNTVP